MEADVLNRISLEGLLGKPRKFPSKEIAPEELSLLQPQWGDDSWCSDSDDQAAKDSQAAKAAKPFVCDVPGCGKAFIKAHFLELHIRTHTEERPFVCTHENCGRSYTRSWHLRRHIDKTHKQAVVGADGEATPARFPCQWDSCERQYSSRDALRKHVARVHEGREGVGRERPGQRLSCSFCHLSFAKHTRLKAHLYQHTGDLPFKCSQESCGKKFLLQSKLRAHEKTHAGYECEKCPGHRFATWTALRKHFKENHNTKRCPKCDKTFARTLHLEAHIATHSDEREAFVCPHEGCDKTYFELKNLHAHQKAAHEGLRFACSLCQKEFRSKQALRRHGRKCLPPPSTCRDPEERAMRAVKTGADRKPRRDKGVPRKRAAEWLTGYNPEEAGDSESSDHMEIDETAVRAVVALLVDAVTEAVVHAGDSSEVLEVEPKSSGQIIFISSDEELPDDLEEKEGDVEAVRLMEEAEGEPGICEVQADPSEENAVDCIDIIDLSDSDCAM